MSSVRRYYDRDVASDCIRQVLGSGVPKFCILYRCLNFDRLDCNWSFLSKAESSINTKLSYIIQPFRCSRVFHTTWGVSVECSTVWPAAPQTGSLHTHSNTSSVCGPSLSEYWTADCKVNMTCWCETLRAPYSHLANRDCEFFHQ